jgi:flagellar hook protein FlgE
MPLTSFYTALTGLNNNSYALNLVGDNLANMNTVAFKSSTASFSELLAGLSGTGESGNPIVLGLGTTLSGVRRSNTQGTITASTNATDVAINGNGYFVVQADNGKGFTRAGNFQIDKNDNLISSDGFSVLGYMAKNGVLDTASELTPLSINMGTIIPAVATQNLSVKANLDCRTAAGGKFSSPVTVYDSLGAAHTVTLDFTKTATGWSWTAAIPGADTGAAPDPVTNIISPTTIGSGSVTFDGTGGLTAGTANATLSITGLFDGASDMDINFNLFDKDGNSNITDHAVDSNISKTVQDGFASSILASISIDSTGVIKGTTAGGQSIILAQLALANFPNADGLQKFKGNTFVTFATSGEPSIGMAGTGGRGILAGSSLEQSNVDMAQEFVNLISAQRAYQANSKVITTSDELSQDSINMKR